MKKIFTLFAAAILAVGANAQTETPLPLGGGWNNGFAGEADVYSFSIEKQYGAADFTCNVLSAEYPKCVIEFEEPLPANFQVNYMWKTAADAEGDATPRYGAAIGDGVKTSFEVTFNPEHPYITMVNVQHTDAVTADMKIKKLVLVDTNDEQKKVAPVFTGWAGTDNTVYYKGTVSFAGMYQQLQIKDVVGKSGITIKVELGETAQNVQMCVDYEDETSDWPKFNGNVATFTTKAGVAIKNVGVQCTTADPIFVEVKGAWQVITGTGINGVKAVANNGELVNAAGQKVGKNYKGLVIDRATGKKFMNR